MLTIRETSEFADWLAGLRDVQARAPASHAAFTGWRTVIPET